MANTLAFGMIVRATQVFSEEGHAYLPTIHAAVTGTSGSSATDQDMATQMDAAAASSVAPVINNNVIYRGTQVQILWPPPVMIAASSLTGTLVGTGGLPAMPRQTAGLATFRTSKAGRAYRGRYFMPGVSQGMSTGTPPAPTNTYINNLATYINDLLSVTTIIGSAGSAAISWIIFHRKTHLGDAIITAAIRGFWATQRRRAGNRHGGVPPF